MPSVGQSLTAPSSPLLTSPFSGVNVASLTSMANISVRPTSSRNTPLPPLPPQSFDIAAYNSSQVKSSTSPSPSIPFPSLQRSQPRVGAATEHQLLAHLSISLGLSDPLNINSLLITPSPHLILSPFPPPPPSTP